MTVLNSKILLYAVAVFSTLSSAASSMTLLALSSLFFAETHDGFVSSSIGAMHYLGVACMGVFGGAILQKFSIPSVGILGPFISGLIVFYLSSIERIEPALGLSAIFIIFFLNGMDHPNNLRFFNEAVHEKFKLSFFSFTESLNAFFSILAPLLAGLIIAHYGVKFCLYVDGVTYMMSCIPWLAFLKNRYAQEKKKVDWLLGFKVMIENPAVRSLTFSRLLNNCAYASAVTLLPLVLARGAGGDTQIFSFRQGFSNSLISIGFILSGIVSAKYNKNVSFIKPLVLLASLSGFLSFLILYASLMWVSFIYVGAFLLGLGTYCFRISGMTLGQAYTPSTALGPTIIAGDTIVRFFSFLISLCTLFTFEYLLDSNLPVFLAVMWGLLIPALALLAPYFSLNLAKEFVRRHSTG